MSVKVICESCGVKVSFTKPPPEGTFQCKKCRRRGQLTRNIIIVVVVVAGVSVAIAVGVWGIFKLARGTRHEPTLTISHSEKIQIGMSLQEVEAVLGPGADLPPDGIKIPVKGKQGAPKMGIGGPEPGQVEVEDEHYPRPTKGIAKTWKGKDLVIFVYFRDNKVEYYLFSLRLHGALTGQMYEARRAGRLQFGPDEKPDY